MVDFQSTLPLAGGEDGVDRVDRVDVLAALDGKIGALRLMGNTDA